MSPEKIQDAVLGTFREKRVLTIEDICVATELSNSDAEMGVSRLRLSGHIDWVGNSTYKITEKGRLVLQAGFSFEEIREKEENQAISEHNLKTRTLSNITWQTRIAGGMAIITIGLTIITIFTTRATNEIDVKINGRLDSLASEILLLKNSTQPISDTLKIESSQNASTERKSKSIIIN